MSVFEWPGNIRQLENTINRAMVMSDNNILDIEDFSTFSSNTKDFEISPPENIAKKLQDIRVLKNGSEFKTVNEIEQEAMALALEHFNQNITRAAKALGMAKSTFYKKWQSVK